MVGPLVHTRSRRPVRRLRGVRATAQPLEPIRRRPVYEQVAERLRTLIEAERLVPGDRLPGERDLAARLRVSRSTVRQALTVLRVMGLVEIRHGTGAYLMRAVDDVIPPIPLESVGGVPLLPAVSEVREVLESHAARLAARHRTAAHLADMAHSIAAMELEIGSGVNGDEGDERFHFAVVAAAENPVLADLLLRLDPSIRRIARASLQRAGQPPRSLATHRLIFEAITRQDEEQAARLMFDHLVVTGAVDR